MLTKLLFPPQWIPTQPYLSLPSLTAFLKANGCDVEQIDINVSFYNDLLSRKALHACYERVHVRFQELESEKELSQAFQKQYATLSSSVLFGDYILDEIENAKKVLRAKDKFYDIGELFRAFKILELGLKLASTAHYPTNLTFHAYDMRYSCRSSRDVITAINDSQENIFIEYFEENTLPEVLQGKPSLIGISIINTSQIIPGLTLASLIKKADKNIHINIGGSVFTRLISEVGRNKELFSLFDSIIVHEGETALLGLIRHLNNEYEIKDIPNLIYMEGSEIKMNRIDLEGEDINSLPAPDFEGFPLDRYFSPELVLPLLSSRGCYWRRCAFCDHSYGYSGNYRPRDVDLLYNDIDTLKNKYRTGFFTFQDEGLSPKLMMELSDEIIDNGLEISWLADSRFEPSFSPELGNKLADAGCKMLYFGLESASERILKCMDKGIKKENALKICRYTTEAGIWTHLFLIFGFPTETREEAKETMDFILQNHKFINSMSFGSFQLTKHSKVYEAPSAFNVDRIVQEDNTDLSLWFEHEAATGMSRQETDEVIQEFYNELTKRYRDMALWSNLDREHLFLYISHYKKAKNKVPDLSLLADLAQQKHQRKKNSTPTSNEFYPVLNEGVFMGRFNFNLALLIHTMMAGNTLGDSLKKEPTNVLFDTDNNRIFTISDFAKDILDRCNGKSNLPEIVGMIKEKYRMTHDESRSKCRSFLDGLIEKNIISNKAE